MKPIKEMDNVGKESKKFFKKFDKALAKYESVPADDDGAMRHVPSDEHAKAKTKFRKYLINEEKFNLVNLLTLLEISQKESIDVAKDFRTIKQKHVEEDTHKAVYAAILDTDRLREKFELGLKRLNDADVKL